MNGKDVKVPMFTVITVCYNSEKSIEDAIKSVLHQNYEDYEYYIVDGGSRDATVSIVKKYEPLFSGRLNWISEKDLGIYDAMNKGVRNTRGEYVVFLNADDQMCEHTLEIVAKVIEEDRCSYPIYYGDSISAYSNNGQVVTKVKKAFPEITLKTLGCGMGVVHQCMYTHRNVFHKVGQFNLKYKVGADWDFLIRSVKAGVPMKYIGDPLSIFMTTGVSQNNHHRERHLIRKDNKLYRFVDIEMFKDIFNPKNILQALVGSTAFQRIRYKYNLVKNKE